MKKMLMLITAFAMTSMVTAASIDWSASVGTVKDPVSTGANLRYADVYLFATTLTGSDLATELEALYTQVLNGQFSDASAVDSAQTAAGGNVVKKTVDGVTKVNTGYYLVVFDPTGKYFQISDVVWVTPYDLTAQPPDPATSASFGNGTIGTNSGGWQEIVPEPTSLALLALGVAAIGLRRKVK